MDVFFWMIREWKTEPVSIRVLQEWSSLEMGFTKPPVVTGLLHLRFVFQLQTPCCSYLPMEWGQEALSRIQGQEQGWSPRCHPSDFPRLWRPRQERGPHSERVEQCQHQHCPRGHHLGSGPGGPLVRERAFHTRPCQESVGSQGWRGKSISSVSGTNHFSFVFYTVVKIIITCRIVRR